MLRLCIRGLSHRRLKKIRLVSLKSITTTLKKSQLMRKNQKNKPSPQSKPQKFRLMVAVMTMPIKKSRWMKQRKKKRKLLQLLLLLLLKEVQRNNNNNQKQLMKHHPKKAKRVLKQQLNIVIIVMMKHLIKSMGIKKRRKRWIKSHRRNKKSPLLLNRQLKMI